MSIIRRAAAHILLVSVYGFTWLVAILGNIIPRRPWKPTGRIMVTGTFHNPGWYLSHVTPLSRSGVKEVILVVDEPQLPLEKVKFVCPPRWVSRLLSRAGAKAIWMIIAGLRYRPDLYMGYHIVPAGCAALVAGSILGRPACYQMTGAPIGLVGGFPEIVCRIGSRARAPKFIEAMATRVVRQFDLVVVRGRKSREYLQNHHIKRPIGIITGSVNGCEQSPLNGRDIHLIFVGRLSPIKQIDQFIAIVGAVCRSIPSAKAAIVGDGPLMTDLQTCAQQLGLADRIEFLGKRKNVESLLSRSRVFVLTSKTEGLSIAMAEAMACGVVPVVADVGELSDLVVDSVNGYLVTPNCVDEYADRILSLLQNDSLWAQHSHRAIDAARRHCDVDVVTRKWRQHLREIIAHRAGVCTEEVLNCTTC